MENTLVSIINDYGYFGLFLLIFIENVFPPIPSEVVLVFGGFLTTQSELGIPLAIVFSTLGSTLGAAVLYLLGRLLSRDRIKRLFSGRVGKALRLKPGDMALAESWFRRYQNRAVLFGRCVPVVRSLISIPAGIARMNPLSFFPLTVAGSAVWNTLLLSVGVLAGGAWESTLKYLDWFSAAAVALMGAVAAIAVIRFCKKRFGGAGKENKKDGE